MSRLLENEVLRKPFPSPPSRVSLLSLTIMTLFKSNKDQTKCSYHLLKSPGDLLNRLGLFCESKMKSFDVFGEIMTRRNSGFSTSYQESDNSGAILSTLSWTSFLPMFSRWVRPQVSVIMTSSSVVQSTLIPALYCIMSAKMFAMCYCARLFISSCLLNSGSVQRVFGTTRQNIKNISNKWYMWTYIFGFGRK